MSFFPYGSFPFVRLLIPLVLGRLLSLFVIPAIWWGWLFVILIVFSVVCFVYGVKTSYVNRWISGVVIFILLVLGGFSFRTFYNFDKLLYAEQVEYVAEVKQVFKSAAKTQTLLLKCRCLKDENEYDFKAMAYVKKDSLNIDYNPGDQILFKANLNTVQSASNPFVFDYSKYLHSQEIKGQFFIQQKSIVRLEPVFTFEKYFYVIRKIAEKKLLSLSLNTDEFGVFTALVLGNKSNLNYELKDRFSGAGVIHVITISGMHVGIIYLILLSLLAGFSGRKLKRTKLFLILAGLWFYAGLTGMAPSVFRATIMFTVFLISKSINRNYNIYHSLAIAAFIILLFNPYVITHLGFWLSFFAVASIVYFYPLINSLIYFTRPWTKYVWSLISVSIAAQIGTFPIVICVFGFFPSWFLLANLLIVPVVPMVLFVGIVLVVSPVQSLAYVLFGGFVADLLFYINTVAEWIRAFPFSQYKGMQFDFFEMLLLYIALVLWVVWRNVRYLSVLKISLFIFFLVGCILIAKSYVRFNESYIVVHQVKRKTVVSVINKGQAICYVSDTLTRKEMDYILAPLWKHQEVSSDSIVYLNEEYCLPIANSHRKCMLISKDISEENLKEVLRGVEVIVFTSACSKRTYSSLFCLFKQKTLVFDSTFSLRYAKQIKRDYPQQLGHAHFVSISGAYVCVDK